MKFDFWSEKKSWMYLFGTRKNNIFVLQCVAVWCSVMQCIAACCSVLQCVAVNLEMNLFGTQKNILGLFFQHTTTPNNTLQHTAMHCNALPWSILGVFVRHWNHKQKNIGFICLALKWRRGNNGVGATWSAPGLQHIATRCNTLQHTATRCNILQHTVTHCNTLQLTATHCYTLQHAATHCSTH